MGAGLASAGITGRLCSPMKSALGGEATVLDAPDMLLLVGCFQGDLAERPPTGGCVVFISGQRLHIPLWRLWRPREGKDAIFLKQRKKNPNKNIYLRRNAQ